MSSKPLGKLARKRTAQATAAQKFADVYGLIAELGRVAESELRALKARVDALEGKRPWWRVWR